MWIQMVLDDNDIAHAHITKSKEFRLIPRIFSFPFIASSYDHSSSNK